MLRFTLLITKFSTHEVERLLRLLEVLIVRSQLVGGGRTGVLEISLARLAKAIFDGNAGNEKVASASDAFREIRDIFPNDDDFQTAFRAKQERSNPKAQYLLRCLEMQERRLAFPGMFQERELGRLPFHPVWPRSASCTVRGTNPVNTGSNQLFLIKVQPFLKRVLCTLPR